MPIRRSSRLILAVAAIGSSIIEAGCNKPVESTPPIHRATSAPTLVTQAAAVNDHSSPPSGRLVALGSSTMQTGLSRVMHFRFDNSGGAIAHLILRIKGNSVGQITAGASAETTTGDNTPLPATVTVNDDSTSIDFGPVTGHHPVWLKLVFDAPADGYWVFVANAIASDTADASAGKLLQSLPRVVTIKPPPNIVRYHSRWIGNGHEAIEGYPEINQPRPKSASASATGSD